MVGGSRAPYPLLIKALSVAGAAIAAIVWVRPIRRVEIGGDSMRPTLEPGDRLLVLRSRRVRPGDLVTVPDPRRPTRTMVKRVASATSQGVVVIGDNPASSTDSRTFGPVPTGSVRGRVVYRYHPDHRRGRPS